MTKTRRVSFIIFGLLFALAGFLFVGCGKPDYSQTSLVCLYEERETTSIELFVGEEKYLDFKIINPASGMSEQLETPQNTNPTKARVELFSSQNYTSRYKVVGLEGGRTLLTMATEDGNIKTEPSIEIIVKQYPSSLTATSENLFLTKEQTFTPSENYFDFGKNTTEKTLEFYFYGKKSDTESLSLDDIKFSSSEIGYSNAFTSISLVQKGEQEYLLFENAQGENYSLASVPTVNPLTGNEHYRFVKITNDNSFATCKTISTGEEFYFVAVYQGKDNEGNDKVLYCERSFKIFEDISVQKTTYYSYQKVNADGEGDKPNENVSSYSYLPLTLDDVWQSETLTLVPDFTTKGEKNPYTNYKVAYLKITTKTNELLKVNLFAQETNYLSGRAVDKVVDEINGTTDYYIEISNSIGENIDDTIYNIQFYYEGYENSTSNAVNLTLQIHVNITIPPQSLLINNQDSLLLGTYTFYNHYKGSGWKSFKFSIDPSDAEVDSLTINLSQSADLLFKYKNVEYSSTSSLGGLVIGDETNKYLSITDLEETVYIKGVENALEVDDKTINIGVQFTLFGKSEEKNFAVKYKITKGARFIGDYEEALYYVDINQNGEIDASSLFKTDASFSTIDFKLISGDDVVKFNRNEDVCKKIDDYYALQFSILDRDVIGQGIYMLWLDNGESVTFKIATDEALSSVSTSTTDIENNVVNSEIDGDKITYYVVNDLSSIKDRVDVQLVANGNKNSKAINDFAIKITNGDTVISTSNISKAKKSFDIVLSGENGGADIEITVKGCNIENFVRNTEYSIVYNIHFVSFVYIDKLNITKNVEAGLTSSQGQEATNCSVYYNTQNETLRKISFNSSVNNNDAFLFYAKNNEGNLSWIEEKFDTKFISWEYRGTMYYSDQNSIETDYGYFNMNSLSFIAKYSNAELNSITETLIARVVQQGGKTYSYTINIHFEKYVEVESLTLASPLTEIRISSLDTKSVEIIAFANNSRLANDPTLIGYFVNNNISLEGKRYEMFSVDISSSDNKFIFTVDATNEFANKAKGIDEELKAKLYIVAKDWYYNDVLDDKYIDKAICIDVVYENGTEKNRYTITDAKQFENFDLDAHYRLATTIDISNVSLPLGDFSGSIVGVNDYAEIIGIKLTDANLTSDENSTSESLSLLSGLFTSINKGAYIDNVTFSGEIKIGDKTNGNSYKNINIGLVAGINYGELRNISVKLSSSYVHAFSGNIGAVVGENQGVISQDYSFTSLSNVGVNHYESYKTLAIVDDFTVTGYNYSGTGTTGTTSGIINSGTGTTETTSGIINFGGVVGKNTGTMQKIDAKEGESFIGYTNYFAYVNLNAVKFKKVNGTSIDYSTTQFLVGGVAGDNQGKLFGAVATINQAGKTEYTSYKNYTDALTSYLGDKVTFEGGKGLVVGGKITANGYEGTDDNFGYKAGKYEGDCVGGIAGLTNVINKNFTGLTSRVFLRSDGNVAGIANDPAKSTSGINAFSLQAVENGEENANASLIVVNRVSMPLNRVNDTDTRTIFKEQTRDFENIAFGIGTKTENLFNGDLQKKVFVTFVKRNKAFENNESEDYSDKMSDITKESYYGDYIIVGSGSNIIYKYFELDEDSININYGIGGESKNNNMKCDDKGLSNAFYAYYFELASVAESVNRIELQDLLDKSYNKLTTNQEFYPIKVVGELTLTSLTPNVLEIDTDGKMTIKRTGIAEISATSILNQTNELKIYIYVINYFNSLADTSIIYPTQSRESTKVEKSEIKIIANNRVNMYVLPDYTIDENFNDTNFTLNESGEGSINNVFMTLKTNDEVTAEVEVKQLNVSTNVGLEGAIVNPTLKLEKKTFINYEIIGNQIILSRTDNIQENVNYNVEVTPIIKFKANENVYKATVNKQLTEVTASYIKGATKIYNKHLDKVTIQSNSVIEDVLTVSTTADSKTEGINYKIYDKGHNEITGLFKVEISYKDKTSQNNVNYLNYSLSISVNTYSEMFKDKENIYQTYTFVFYPYTNDEISLSLPVTLERTDVSSISITNYSSSSITSSSELINPGKRGYLAISIAPIDGEFDYIVIENDPINYTDGHSSAVFGISARKTSVAGSDSLFEDNSIIGSNRTNGILFTREEIETFYSDKKYESFNGMLYVNYIFDTANVDNNSISTISVKAYKNNSPLSIADASKPLTVKLPFYAKLSINNKVEENGYYPVARGVEYKLNVDTYGYDKDLIEISSESTNLGEIINRNGEYYVKITAGKVSYASGNNEFAISLTTTDDDMIPFTDTIKIRVQEYVVSYDFLNKDIISGMGDGVINVQIGSAFKFEVDLYDYIEFNSSDVEISSKVKEFMNSMVKNGKWTAKTNLTKSGDSIATDKTWDSGEPFELSTNSIENYYFKYSNYKLTPIKTHEPIEKGYKITYSSEYLYNSAEGVYKVVTNFDNAIKIDTEFTLNVYTSSSDQSPIPIFEYRDLLKMQDGGYYILLNNIVIPNEETTIEETGEVVPAFSPITAKFASLDGNGLSLIFEKGKYDVGSATQVAPFATLSEGSIIKNLTILYRSTDTSAKLEANGIGTKSGFTPELTYFETSASVFTFGGVVAENAGSITNCKVITEDDSYLSVYAPNSVSGVTEECYMGLIAGSNSGYITNSTVSVNVQAPFSIGGIVGTNDGKISGCAFKEGIITNVLSKTGAVAGIAVTNGENAQILTSFVRGIQSSTSVISSKIGSYGVDSSSIISSPYSASGFVYQNRGKISDCYTDINLKGITSADGGMGYKISGFVGENGGEIRNSYSLSLLPSNRDSSAGFAETNKVDDNVGSFSNCFYLSDSSKKISSETINVDLKKIDFEGVEKLKLDEFNPNNGKFAEYAHKLTMSNESVWFYPNGSTGENFVEYSITGNVSQSSDEAISGKVVFLGKVETKNITFACGRLELVNPNTQVVSRRIFDSAIVNEETGEITYNYIDEEGSPQRGDLHNPRLIYSAQTMEDEILSATSKTGLNTSNYRFVGDADYSDYVGLSQLYKVTYAGIMEGNGMTISNIGLESNESLSNAGVLAGVGYSQYKRGSVKNLNFQIERVEFSKTTNVGGVVGTLRYGELHGIVVTSTNSSGGTVVGNNFVGGIVGKAIIDYEITDVYSELSATSSFMSDDATLYGQTTSDEKNYSYAGAIAGFLGKGTLYNARSANVNSVVAGKAGFAYGGLGEDARINYTYVDIKAGATIKANLYAGLVTGENAGSMDYVYVSDNGTDDYIFDVSATIPYAVGGIAGRLAGGLISNAVNYQTMNVSNLNKNDLSIQTVGGIVGTVDAESASLSRIYDSLSTADIYAREIGGGAIGRVLSALRLDGVAIKSSVINISGQTPSPIAGGIIAYNEATITITNSYSNANIELRTYTPGVDATAFVGGLIASNNNTAQLSYCYTTSTVDAEVYDARALGSVKDFSNLKIDTEGEVSIKYAAAEVTYENVYYFGGSDISETKKKPEDKNTEEDKSTDYSNLQDYILFRSKTKNAKITLKVNNFGKDSRSLKEVVTDDNATVLAGKDTMNNLFINRYRYNNEVYYKVPDLQVKRGDAETREVGFIARTKNDAGELIWDTANAYYFKENSDSKLLKVNSDSESNSNEVNLEAFTQLKVYRDKDRNIYYDDVIKDKSNNPIKAKVKVFGERLTDEEEKKLDFIEVWNFKTWGELTSLAFEKNLNWLNKATLGK